MNYYYYLNQEKQEVYRIKAKRIPSYKYCFKIGYIFSWKDKHWEIATFHLRAFKEYIYLGKSKIKTEELSCQK